MAPHSLSHSIQSHHIQAHHITFHIISYLAIYHSLSHSIQSYHIQAYHVTSHHHLITHHSSHLIAYLIHSNPITIQFPQVTSNSILSRIIKALLFILIVLDRYSFRKEMQPRMFYLVSIFNIYSNNTFFH